MELSEDLPNTRNHEQDKSGGHKHPSDIAGLGFSSQSVAGITHAGTTHTS